MAYEVNRLTSRHDRIFDMILAGAKKKEVAAAMGVSETMVHSITNSPLGQAELARRREGVNGQVARGIAGVVKLSKSVLEEASLDAAVSLTELMGSMDESIKFRSAKEILDKVYGSEQKGVQQTVVVLNADKLSVLLEALRESRSVEAKPVLENERSMLTLEASEVA